jgi:orotidine-5'-phosphate decarboxylase
MGKSKLELRHFEKIKEKVVAMNKQNPIILALDVPSAAEAFTLADNLAAHVGAFKIGSELFTAAGPEIVKGIRARGGGVFLDLKFHDIPNTVSKAVAAAVRLDVQILNVHCSGGFEMMRVAAESAATTAAKLGKTPPLVIGVTVLTSMDIDTLLSVGVDCSPGDQVERLAELAVRAGLDGLVCSPLETLGLRELVPDTFQLINPAIRMPNAPQDDQKRTATPCDAIRDTADWLVVGRPIYAAADSVKAVEEILVDVERGRQLRQVGV